MLEKEKLEGFHRKLLRASKPISERLDSKNTKKNSDLDLTQSCVTNAWQQDPELSGLREVHAVSASCNCFIPQRKSWRRGWESN